MTAKAKPIAQPSPVAVVKKRILVVDDHPAIRLGVRAFLEEEVDLCVCGEAESAPAAVSAVEALRPDLVLVDLTLKNSHGLDLVKDLRALFPKLPLLVYSAHPDTLFAERAIRAGASGYVGKLEGMTVLLQAIRQALAGHLHLSEPLATRLVERSLRGKDLATDDPERQLSDRELQVWQLTGEGHTPTEIAEALRLERKTVEFYRRSARKKLKLPSLTELERLAFLESCLPVSSLARRNGMSSHGVRSPLGFPA